VEWFVYLLSFVFGAGVAWAQFRRMKRDLNGVGKKLEQLRWIVLHAAPEGKRQEIIERFLKN
jgi:hypothetical protein